MEILWTATHYLLDTASSICPVIEVLYSEALDSDLKFTSVADDDDTWYVDDGGWAQYYCDGDAARTDDTLADSNEAWLQTIVEADCNETIKFYWITRDSHLLFA